MNYYLQTAGRITSDRGHIRGKKPSTSLFLLISLNIYSITYILIPLWKPELKNEFCQYTCLFLETSYLEVNSAYFRGKCAYLDLLVACVLYYTASLIVASICICIFRQNFYIFTGVLCIFESTQYILSEFFRRDTQWIQKKNTVWEN